MAASAFLIVYFLYIEVVMSQLAQEGDSCQNPTSENLGAKAHESSTDPEDCNKYITCPPQQERRNFYAGFLRGRTVAMFLGVMFHEKEQSTILDISSRLSHRSIKQATENICGKYVGASEYANCETKGEESRCPHEDCTKYFTCEINMEYNNLCPGAEWEYKGTDPNINDGIQIKNGICSSKAKQCLLYLSGRWSLLKSEDYDLLPSASTGLYVSGPSRNSPKFNPKIVSVYRTMEYKCLRRPENVSFNNKLRSTISYRNLYII